MRIGFDVRPFLKEETGVGIYFKNLLFELAQIDHSNEYFLFSSSWKDRFLLEKIPSFEKMEFRDFHLPVKAVNFFWFKIGWPPLDFFFKTGLDLTHSPTPLLLPTKGKKIVTVYDLFFMDFPDKTDRETRKNFLKKTKKALEKADGIITISQFTKSALLERFNLEEKKVRVIYLGLDQKFRQDISFEELDRIRKKIGFPSFILFVGALEPRKNIGNLIEALKIIHREYKKIFLVLVGRKGQDYNRVIEKIAQNGLEQWVKLPGYLPDDEVRILYRLASVFAFPSSHEGFGLPLLEAMASGLPIAASQVTALPEIAQDAALYFRPENPEDIAEKIIALMKNEGLRKTLVARGRKRVLDFEWGRTAVETLNFYHSVAGK
jgi:glycosyltransferase involved in cell wall biosynthesis